MKDIYLFGKVGLNMNTFFLYFFSLFPWFNGGITEKTVIFDPNLHMFAVYSENGFLRRAGPASGGRKYCPDIGRSCKTPSGKFTILSKHGPNYRSTLYPVGCEVKKRNCIKIPYYVKFEYSGAGFHYSNDVPKYKNASHGCIRLQKEDAIWLNQYVETGKTIVIVKEYD